MRQPAPCSEFQVINQRTWPESFFPVNWTVLMSNAAVGVPANLLLQPPIPAENDGLVALAKYFGIYGNAVVLDHGFGLMTLYGHLASVSVSQGQSVRTGDTLGLSGETGLAGGDHLHFTILLHGLPVNPVEWWDSHWIRDRISKKLGPAFPFEE